MNAVVDADKPIRILREGLAKVQPLLDQLAKYPELWDENVFRTETPGVPKKTRGKKSANPHAKISDIILRFNDWRHWTGDRAAFNAEHDSVWWGAVDKLTYIKPLVFDLMRMFEAERLGMVLLTRIPAHCEVAKHVDRGWHAEHYLKFGVQIAAAPGQKFCYEGYSLETRVGDVFAFDNSRTHWVENPTDAERITLIICLRLEQPHCRDYLYKGRN